MNAPVMVELSGETDPLQVCNAMYIWYVGKTTFLQ